MPYIDERKRHRDIYMLLCMLILIYMKRKHIFVFVFMLSRRGVIYV